MRKAGLTVLTMVFLFLGCSDELAREHKPYAIYKDPAKPIDQRVEDLISRMTLAEKVSQSMYKSPAIERLDVPKYVWWNESLHGVARAGRATVFPQAIGLAATFDPELIFRVGDAISDEARAKHHGFVKRGMRVPYGGLTFWSPNINIFRDPRWGRGQETYGEDPFLTGRMGAEFVRGIQGDHRQYLKAAACAKHYAVHSGPEGDRHHFNAVVSPKDLHETYLPAFKALVDAGVESVMCAYNRTNDQACCGSELLMVEILRRQWAFKGHVVSDCWALEDFHTGHNITENSAESAALAMNKGCNLNCGSTYPALIEAVEQGLVTEDTIDKSLAILLRTRFKLGLFDDERANPYASISEDVIGCEEHTRLAREAAQKSIVLLKNKNNILPLKKDLKFISIVGPNAGNIDVLLGNYHGVNSNMVTAFEGVVGKIGKTTLARYRYGCLLDRENPNPIDWTTGIAKVSDVTIAFMGMSTLLEGEEGEAISSYYRGDRREIALPKNQVDFVKKLCKYGKPVVLVLFGGSPVAIPELHELVDAVLFVWYPGQQGGNAIADVLFGDVCPSGRLPITFPVSLEQLGDYDDYSMAGRTYRYMTQSPLYPFGFGLSYTTFAYSELRLNESSISRGDSVTAKFKVTNSGDVFGQEVVQLYISDLNASVEVPLYALKDIKRVELKPGQSKRVEFTITPEMMELIDSRGRARLEAGEFKVWIGGSSPAERSRELGAAEMLSNLFIMN